jgi:hypothetical protein
MVALSARGCRAGSDQIALQVGDPEFNLSTHTMAMNPIKISLFTPPLQIKSMVVTVITTTLKYWSNA